MKKNILYFCIFYFFIFTSFLEAKEFKNVLIINSYHKGFQWSDTVISNMQNVFYENDISSTILYMDGLRMNKPDYLAKLIELYKLQFEYNNYDLIITVDEFAYDFILENYNEITNNQPIYFVGLEHFSKKKIQLLDFEKKISGLIKKRAISENFEIISTLIPKIKKLYIIDKKNKYIDDEDISFDNFTKDLNLKYKIEYIKDISFDELNKKFAISKKDEAILFIKFDKDSKGKEVTNKDKIFFINNAKLPVFITDTQLIGKGGVGGKLLDIESLGIHAGKNIVDILTGAKQHSSISTANSYSYIFDYKQAKKFDIKPLFLHKPFSYVNSSLSYFEENRFFINFIFIIFPLFVFLVIALMHNLFLRIKSSKLLEQRILFNKVLLNAIKSPILWHDTNGSIVDSNTKFIELSELKNVDTLSDFLIKRLPENIENKELKIYDNQGEELIYLIDKTPYSEDIFNTSGYVTILTDITKEKKALNEKQKQQGFIIQQSKLAEIGEIFSSIAHQWKTPLIEISTIVQLQSNNFPNKELDEKNNEYVNDIMVQVKYMANTIDDFQTFIMPSTNKSVFNIKDALKKMMEIIHHNIKYNYIKLEINEETKNDLQVLGYKNELMQTLLNVVNNAKQAIISQRKIRKLKDGFIKINIKKIKESILIEIEDNAGGIEESNLDKIFDPYFTTKENGHGIGLYMAKLIIEEKMNGKIYAENTNIGLRVSIKLKIQKS